MNNHEFGDNNWSLKEQLLYICKVHKPQSFYCWTNQRLFSVETLVLISAGVVLVSLLFAFSSWIRARIWSFCSRASTKFATRTGIYTYIARRKHVEEIFDETYSVIDRMKRDAKKTVPWKDGRKEKSREKASREKRPRYERQTPDLRRDAWGKGAAQPARKGK